MHAVFWMVVATGLFAGMGVTVKLSAAMYDVTEVVFYRGLIGALMMWAWARAQGVSLRTAVPGMHAGRSVAGVSSLVLWFHAIGQMPLAAAVTLNYMSSLWIAAIVLLQGLWRRQPQGGDRRLSWTVLAGFAGVVLVLRPSLDGAGWSGPAAGLASGLLSAAAYLQVGALGRAGEPEARVVFYFSLGSLVAGAVATSLLGPWHGHHPQGLALLVATGVLATLAQMALTRAYTLGRPLVNASLQYLGIVYALGFGAWLFNDRIDLPAIGGMALIIAAGIAATRLRAAQPTTAAAPTAQCGARDGTPGR